MQRHPERVQIVLLCDSGEQDIPYAKLRSQAAVVTAGLHALALKRGQTVAIMLPSGAGYFFTYLERGKAIQRQRIARLGGRNLAGNNPNLDGLGVRFRYESKSGPGAFSVRYWRWLTDIPVESDQTQVLIVTEKPGPGRKARSYVVVRFEDWEREHGESAVVPATEGGA